WRPRDVEGTPTGARLLVGPEIVDRMWNDELVRIEIPEVEYAAQASWDSIPVSAVRPTAVEDDQEDKERPAPPTKTAPQTKPAPPKPPQTGAPPITVPDGPAPGDTKGDAPAPRPEPQQKLKPDPHPPPERPWLIPATAALGVCLGLFFGYRFVAAVPTFV